MQCPLPDPGNALLLLVDGTGTGTGGKDYSTVGLGRKEEVAYQQAVRRRKLSYIHLLI